MNLEPAIKKLLVKLGRKGHDVSLIKEQRYSREFDSVYSRHKLTFWEKGKGIDKKTKQEKEISIPTSYEFSNVGDLAKFMVVISNEPKAESVR